MNKFLMTVFVIFMFVGAVNAFTNSLDQNVQPQQSQGYNSLSKQNQNNNQNSTLNPKTHDSMNHQKEQFPTSTVNPSRYNTNCKFGVCIPGGINPNSR